MAVALAAKIAMLAAASRTCAVEPSSQDQRDLLEQVAAVTALKHVNGRPFDEFLGDAKERLATRAVEERLDSGRAAATLSDIADARPVDIIGDLYPELVRLAADLYEPVLGERIDPPLERDVLEYGRHAVRSPSRGTCRQVAQASCSVSTRLSSICTALRLCPT